MHAAIRTYMVTQTWTYTTVCNLLTSVVCDPYPNHVYSVNTVTSVRLSPAECNIQYTKKAVSYVYMLLAVFIFT